MNSVIEAQQQFTECFGDLSLRHLCNENLLLPHFSLQEMELCEFIKNNIKSEKRKNHPSSTPIVIGATRTTYLNIVHYKFYH